MAPPPSDRRPSRTGFELDSEPPPSDGDEPATRKELRKVVKHFDRQVADLHSGFAAHRVRVSADITGSVSRVVAEQIGPMKETVAEAKEILVEQELRAKIKAEQEKEAEKAARAAELLRAEHEKKEEAARARRNVILGFLSPIILALIGVWAAWVARATSTPAHEDKHHEERK